MRIKHFAGYGCVNAFRIKDKECDLHIQVVGNHEWGIERNDTYDAFRWLVKRFKRNIGEDDRIIKEMKTVSGYTIDENGNYIDTCDYYFNFYKE